VKIYFIDANGNIVARYKRYKRLWKERKTILFAMI
jgi:hypothetical protein